MSETEPQAAPQSNLATLPPAQRAAVVLQSEKAEQELRGMVERTAAITIVVDPNGRKEAHAAAMMLKNARVAISNSGKAARDDANAFGKAVIAEEKRLIAITEPEEERLFKLRDDFDAAERRRLEEEAERERQRVGAIKARIAAITSLAATLAAAASAEITAKLAELANRDLAAEDFAEFEAEARAAMDTTASALIQLRNAARMKEEEEAARLAAQEAERVRLAEEAERQRLAAEAQRQEAERQRMEAQRLAVEQARLRAEQAQREADERAAAERRAQIAARVKSIQKMGTEQGDARATMDRLDQLRQIVVDDWFGDMRDFAEIARDTSITAAELRLARILPPEIEAAHIEAMEINDEMDAQHQARMDALAKPDPAPEAITQTTSGGVVHVQVGAIEQTIPAPARPDDFDIVQAIAHQFDVTGEIALAWVASIDVDKVRNMLASV